MLALHQLVERALLVGTHIESLPPPPAARAPAAITPLIEAIADAHRRFDELAIHYGHRYRSVKWLQPLNRTRLHPSRLWIMCVSHHE